MDTQAAGSRESLWYYAVSGQKIGPVSFSELRQVAASGRLGPTDMVLENGTATWQYAACIPGLWSDDTDEQVRTPIPRGRSFVYPVKPLAVLGVGFVVLMLVTLVLVIVKKEPKVVVSRAGQTGGNPVRETKESRQSEPASRPSPQPSPVPTVPPDRPTPPAEAPTLTPTKEVTADKARSATLREVSKFPEEYEDTPFSFLVWISPADIKLAPDEKGYLLNVYEHVPGKEGVGNRYGDCFGYEKNQLNYAIFDKALAKLLIRHLSDDKAAYLCRIWFTVVTYDMRRTTSTGKQEPIKVRFARIDAVKALAGRQDIDLDQDEKSPILLQDVQDAIGKPTKHTNVSLSYGDSLFFEQRVNGLYCSIVLTQKADLHPSREFKNIIAIIEQSSRSPLKEHSKAIVDFLRAQSVEKNREATLGNIVVVVADHSNDETTNVKYLVKAKRISVGPPPTASSVETPPTVSPVELPFTLEDLMNVLGKPNQKNDTSILYNGKLRAKKTRDGIDIAFSTADEGLFFAAGLFTSRLFTKGESDQLLSFIDETGKESIIGRYKVKVSKATEPFGWRQVSFSSNSKE